MEKIFKYLAELAETIKQFNNISAKIIALREEYQKRIVDIDNLSRKEIERIPERYQELERRINSYKVIAEDFMAQYHTSPSIVQEVKPVEYKLEVLRRFWIEMENEGASIQQRLDNALQLYFIAIANEKWITVQKKVAQQEIILANEVQKKRILSIIQDERLKYSSVCSALQKRINDEYAIYIADELRKAWKEYEKYNCLYSYNPIDNVVKEVLVGSLIYKLPQGELEFSTLRERLYPFMIDNGIFIPYIINLSKKRIHIEYTKEKENIVKIGIQGIIAQLLSSNPKNAKVFFLDPVYRSNTRLGKLMALCGKYDMPIINVAQSEEELNQQIQLVLDQGKENAKNIRPGETVFQYNEREKNGRIIFSYLILNNYPEGYTESQKKKIATIIANSLEYGIFIISTNLIKLNNENKSDYLEDNILTIHSKGEEFYTDEGIFFFLSEQVALSDDYCVAIRNKYKKSEISITFNDFFPLSKCDTKRCKGRVKFTVPFGVKSNGAVAIADFTRENCAAFISGAIGSGKSTLLHTLITNIILENHPDDIDLWLVDFNMKEFSLYLDKGIPHIKNIILEKSPEIVYDLIDKLLNTLELRKKWFSSHGYTDYNQIPSNVYLPRIIVVVDEFEVMSSILFESMNSGVSDYAHKLQQLLQQSSAFGFNYIFSNQTFSAGVRGLTETARNQIGVRFAMANTSDEKWDTLAIPSSQITDNVRGMVDTLPVHQVIFRSLVKVGPDEYAYKVERLKTLKIEESDTNLVASFLSKTYQCERKFSILHDTVFLDKHPLYKDGRKLDPFYDWVKQVPYYERSIYKSNKIVLEADDKFLFLGTPCKIANVYPVTVSRKRDENLIVFSGTSDQRVGIVLAAIKTFERKSEVYDWSVGAIELWSNPKSNEFRDHRIDQWQDYECIEDLKDIWKHINKYCEYLLNDYYEERLIICFDITRIIDELQNYNILNSKRDHGNLSQSVSDVPDGFNFDALLSSIEEGCSGYDYPIDTDATTASESEKLPNVEEFIDKMKFILQMGPTRGIHFLFTVDSLRTFQTSGISLERFFHRLSFGVSRDDSYEIFGNVLSGVNLESNVFRYSNGINSFSMRLFAWPGVSYVADSLEDMNATLFDEDDSDGIIMS